MIVHNGQIVPVSGWYVDRHGHRLFLQRGKLTPMCPSHNVGVAMWQLRASLPEPATPAGVPRRS
jgi:hypothetical protein